MSEAHCDALPERSIMLHIGPYKTGTSALQAVAAVRRPELLANGVRYPGTAKSHRLQANAFSGRGGGWSTADGKPVTAAPPLSLWQALKAEIDAETQRRIWVGHENISMVDEATARRWMDELGPRTHVVITLRPFSRMLPSLWQESLKRNAGRGAFEAWLRDRQRLGTPDMLHDPARLVRRWATVAGPERVSVVVVDSARPAFLFEAFEQLLALPEGLLVDTASADRQNRSLTVAEAELLRRLNRRTRAAGLEWSNHEWLVFSGSVMRMLRRPPEPDEARLQLPEWASTLATAHDQVVRDAVVDTGVGVVGDVSRLIAPPPSQPSQDPSTVTHVPVCVAAEALAGAIAFAVGRSLEFGVQPWPARRKVSADLKTNAPAMLRALVRPQVPSTPTTARSLAESEAGLLAALEAAIPTELLRSISVKYLVDAARGGLLRRPMAADGEAATGQIAIDAVVEAMVGVIAAATGRDADFGRTRASVWRKVVADVTGAPRIAPSALRGWR